MTIGGYRVTESSDERILEDGSLRVTENLFSVESSISASSSYDFVPTLSTTGAITVSSIGTLAAAGDVTRYAAILIANNSTITAISTRTTTGAFNGSVVSSVDADLDAFYVGMSTFSGNGSVVAAARTVKFVNFISGIATFDRILENEDYRITEGGDSRITNEIAVNTVDSTVVADATLIPFSSTVYYKTGGVWKTTLVDAKYNGNWDALTAVYKKISGSWKRIH